MDNLGAWFHLSHLKSRTSQKGAFKGLNLKLNGESNDAIKPFGY